MKTRIAPGVVIAGLWLLLLLKGSPLLFGLVAALLVLWAADEYARMVDSRTLSLIERWLVNGCLALPTLLVCIRPQLSTLGPATLAAFFLIILYFLYRYQSLDNQFDFFCRLALGVVYLGFLCGHLVLLRNHADGAAWLVIGSAITAGSDSGAYFVGKAIGKRKLCPNISPNKTVEGAVGGVIAGVLSAVVLALLVLPAINWPFLLISSVLLCLVGIVGDLTESIIKRGTGTKDSGRCLAGHGGILDRVDSLLFVGPVLYYLVLLSGP